jgi:heme/copper-type cytochrome/quinol oxidase subunit 2
MLNTIRWKRLLVMLSLGLAVLFVPFPAAATTPSEHTFHIDASRFEYSPNTIKVEPGDRVTIELAATDVVHGLSIDGYDLAMTADPGQTASLTFTADQEGSFRFRCTASCGNMHPFMIGKLTVGQNTLLWRGAGLFGVILMAVLWKLKK